jgi:ParB-like chromosome segregation protein Spo0J
MSNRKKETDTQTDIQISELRVATWYKNLCVFERDCTSLRASFAKHGFKREYPVVVRQLDRWKEEFEIVCGYQRVKIAEEFYLEKVPAVIKNMDEEGARKYALEDNLSSARIFAPISPVQAIILSRDLERCGGTYQIDKILERSRIGKATYKRVGASLTYALGRLHSRHVELSELDEAGVIAESFRRNLWPEFNDFCKGKMPPYTFYHTYYLSTGIAERRSEKQRKFRNLPAKQAQIRTSNGAAVEPIDYPSSPNYTAALRGILQLACQASQVFGLNESGRHLSQEQLQTLNSFAGERGRIASVLEAILVHYGQSDENRPSPSRNKQPLSPVKSPAPRRTKMSAEAPALLPLFPLEDNA